MTEDICFDKFSRIKDSTIPIETDLVFGIPLGTTQIPTEICRHLQHCPSFNQDDGIAYEERPELYNVLQYNTKLKNAITELFTLWIKNLTGDTTQKWVMTTNWVTENSNGRAMTFHAHTNCLYSAVLYFDEVDENHPPLELLNPFNASLSTGLTTDFKEATLINAHRYRCPIHQGLMIMFPSFIVHGHPSFESNKSRKSFACNFFPVGRYGWGDSTLDTNWLQYDD